VSEAPRPEGPLVGADWLADHLGAVRVVDVRGYLDGRSGREAYRGGHIPGAVFADLDTDLAAPPDGVLGRHPLPSPEAFAAALARLGIAHGDTVVAYDDMSGANAARLWWMLDAIGVACAVLDGGIQAWTGALSTEDPVVEPADVVPRLWPQERFADAEEVDRLRRDPDALVLDARSAGRFTGEEPSIDTRPGHIPGARSAPWQGNVEPGSGRLLAPDALRRRFAELGAEGRRIVTSCGSGVTACQELLALRLAGFDDVALYTGSYSGWTADPSRPVAEGAA
jgi:thiosulfate/3-mercaptopyruvate sulfurtransferase